MVTSSLAVGGQVGNLVPEISLPCLDGGDLGLRELRGRRVLLFFWGSW